MTNHRAIDEGAPVVYAVGVEAELTAATELASEPDMSGEAWWRSADVVRGPDWPWVAEPREGGGSSPFRLLVPYNGTPAARSALDVAVELGSGRPVLAWILYVRHWDVARGGHRFSLETSDEARTCAHSAVAELRRRGIPASGVMRDAPRERVGHTIVGEAERLDVGCIVLGTHAHGPIVSALTGSVPRHVARAATRPTILVRASHDSRRSRPRSSAPSRSDQLLTARSRRTG